MYSDWNKVKYTVRTPDWITTGVNILTLDPGFYIYQDEKASDSDKIAMGLPIALWHTHINIFGIWSNADKTLGYISVFVTDCGTANKIYYRSLTWDVWAPWQIISMAEL